MDVQISLALSADLVFRMRRSYKLGLEFLKEKLNYVINFPSRISHCLQLFCQKLQNNVA